MLVGINIFLLSLYFYLYHFHKKFAYKHLFKEDGIFENLQALLFLGCAILLLLPKVKQKLTLPKWQNWSWFSAFTFVFLEEVSYGQRVFGWKWTWLQVNNHQHETNLHNLLPLFGSITPYLLFIVMIAMMIPLIEFFGERKQLCGRFLLEKSFIISMVNLGLWYIFLPKYQHPFFYEFSELNIAASFFILIVMKVLKSEKLNS